MQKLLPSSENVHYLGVTELFEKTVREYFVHHGGLNILNLNKIASEGHCAKGFASEGHCAKGIAYATSKLFTK